MAEGIRIILYLIVISLSNMIETITGFAGTLLAMPPSMLLIGIDEAKTVLNIMSLLTCLWITIKNYKYINKEELLKMFWLMLVGMIIGIIIFEVLPINFLLKIYAILIISIAIHSLFFKKKEQQEDQEEQGEINTSSKVLIEEQGEINVSSKVLIGVVILAGIIHGMFVSGGALLVIYAVNTLKDKDEFRATLAPLWICLNGIMMLNHIYNGYITRKTISIIIISIPPLLIGIAIGNILHKHIKEKQFLVLTYILLICSGTMLLL